jgi:hypothetical protein
MALPSLDPLSVARNPIRRTNCVQHHLVRSTPWERGAGWRARGTSQVMHEHGLDSPRIVRDAHCHVARREVTWGVVC